MVCNPAIRVPATCLAATIQGRRRRGRPSARGSDVGDVAEARARERVELGKEYRLPKVILCMLLTPLDMTQEALFLCFYLALESDVSGCVFEGFPVRIGAHVSARFE